MFKRNKGIKVFTLITIFSIFFSSNFLIHAEDTYDGVWLQERVNSALDNELEIITIDKDVVLNTAVTVPANKNIVIVDNGEPRTITTDATSSVSNMFIIQAGASLSLDTTSKDNSYLVFDGKNMGASSRSIFYNEGSLILHTGTITNFNGQSSSRGAVITIGSEASFIMNGGLVTKNTFSSQYGGIILIKEGADFTMNGGEISNNNSAITEQINNGVIYVEASGSTSQNKVETTFTLNNGLITNNSSERGTVFLGEPAYPDYYSLVKMVMNGGEISHNEALYTGGGVFVCGQATFEMNDGKITRNTAVIGGGVSVYDLYTTYGGGYDHETWKQFFKSAFTMNGGEISYNIAANTTSTNDAGCGGGLYVASDNITLNVGKIIGNTASEQGGGVYVGSVPYTLNLYNVIVTENTADLIGGGVWLCPTGDAINYIDKGSAIFNNKATGAADDVVTVWLPEKEHYITLTERILGGGIVDWYQDGVLDSTSTNQLGEIDPSVPRYNSNQPGQPITNLEHVSESLALKAIVSENAIKVAENEAKLFITNNHSYRGGGIGSNGEVIFGGTDEEYTVKVIKEWDSKVMEDDQVSITAHLKIGEHILDNVVLNKANNWSASFTSLPNPKTLTAEIAIIEDPVPDGFEVVYSPATIDETTKTITFVLTNQYVPTEEPTGKLSITKTVSGTIDKNQVFDFRIRLLDENNEELLGSFTFTGTKEGKISSGHSLGLKHEETITIEGIPVGTKYEVEELNNASYKVTSSGEIGTIKEVTSKVMFHNHLDQTPPNTKTPPKTGVTTGDLYSASIYIILLSLASTLLGLYICRRELTKQK